METLPAMLKDLPAAFWEIPWDADRWPGNVPRSELALGADDNLFAYELLAHFGFRIPDLRSAELWRDNDSTQVVLEPRPLDIAMFHDRQQAYGAHVGVICSETEVVHLCKEVGKPTVWTFEKFATTPRYSHLVGFKRPLLRL